MSGASSVSVVTPLSAGGTPLPAPPVLNTSTGHTDVNKVHRGGGGFIEMTHSEELSVTHYIKIPTGGDCDGRGRLCSGGRYLLFIHSNVISSHSEACRQLGQRLQAIEMKMADCRYDR